MKLAATISIFLLSALSFSQSAEAFTSELPNDSAMVYNGEGALNKGNCIYIKYTGDAQLFFNELAKFHTQDNDQIERTKLTLNIYDTSKPYWVYGRYSVFAELHPKGDFTLIEIYFKAYANPENYKMYSADAAYQGIINDLLKK